MTKSHIPTANALAQTDVSKGQLANESQIRLKRGRLIGSKDLTPHKRRTQKKIGAPKGTNIKQRATIEAYGEQEALVEAFNE